MVKYDIRVLDKFGNTYSFIGVDYHTNGSYIYITERKELAPESVIIVPESLKYENEVHIFFNPIYVKATRSAKQEPTLASKIEGVVE